MATVRAALAQVVDPCSIATGVPISLADMGLITNVHESGAEIVVELRLTSPFCMQVGNIARQVEKVTQRIPDLGPVRLEIDSSAEWIPQMMAPEARERLRRVRPFPVQISRGRPATQ